MSKPGSIHEEAIRIQRVSHLILEFGFLEFLEDEQIELLVDAITSSDIDLYRDQEEWLPDLIKTAKWFLKLHKLSLVEDNWFYMMLTAIRRQGDRLDLICDDYDDGESWKHIAGG